MLVLFTVCPEGFRAEELALKTIARVIALAALAIYSLPSLACSCVGSGPVCSEYWKTPILFLGKVVGAEYHEVEDKPTKFVHGEFLVRFGVIKQYRGESGNPAIVHTPSQESACGFGFQAGHTYLVYGYKTADGSQGTGLCTRTHEVTSRQADPDLQWLEALPNAPPGGSMIGHVEMLRRSDSGRYDSKGLPEVAVSINGPTSVKSSSDTDGDFRVDGLIPGTYEVSADLPKEYGGSAVRTATIADHGCVEMRWIARIDGHIRGHVYFADGSPAAGVYLTIQAVNVGSEKKGSWRAGIAITDADGGFDFASLESGSYVFAANMDFPPMNGKPYYRKAFYSGRGDNSQPVTLKLGVAETLDEIRFILPPDSPPPSKPLPISVLGFDGKPVPNALIAVYDDMWGLNLNVMAATADELGKATLTLRPDSHYVLGTSVMLSDRSWGCAEPVEVDTKGSPTPKVIKLNHHESNCKQFRKSSAEAK
jgi:protocatechuate 3,4-dioxygenase beta subunit